jgi:hypothetical protein
LGAPREIDRPPPASYIRQRKPACPGLPMNDSSSSRASDRRPGSAVGPYRLQRELGGGGMGHLYMALGPDGTIVALKLVKADLAIHRKFPQAFRARGSHRTGTRASAYRAGDRQRRAPWGSVSGPEIRSGRLARRPTQGARPAGREERNRCLLRCRRRPGRAPRICAAGSKRSSCIAMSNRGTSSSARGEAPR